MRDWTKYDKQSIFNDKKKGGLLVSFLTEYKEHFKLNTVNASCAKCFNSYYENYLNSLPMAKEIKEKVECDYVLHKKYNGIQLGTNGRPIRNGEMTNEVAEQLLKEHPHGAKLFEIMPEQLKKKETSENKEESEPSKLEIARQEYKEKFGKNVPNKFKNRLDWILNRLGKG